MASNADDDEAGDTQSILAIILNDKEMAAALYSEIDNSISAASIAYQIGEIEAIFYSLKVTCSPSLLIIHPKIMNNQLIYEELIKKTLNDGYNDTYRHISMKTVSWNADNAFDILLNKLTIRKGDDFAVDGQKRQLMYMKISSMIDIESAVLRQAMSALLTHMQTAVFHLDDGNIVISSLKPLVLPGYMLMDANTIQSLQIFAQELHPSAIKTGKSKEGYSLFSVFDRTKSKIGRERLKQWMLRPFFQVDQILERQSGIAVVIAVQNRDYILKVTKALRHIYDMPKLVLRIKKAESSHLEWGKLNSSLESALLILSNTLLFMHSTERGSDRKYLASLIQGINHDALRAFYVRLGEVVNFKESAEQQQIVINNGFDDHLDQLLVLMERLPGILAVTTEALLEMCPLVDYSAGVRTELFTDIGYLFVIKVEHTEYLPPSAGNGDNDGFKHIFSKNGLAYYKHRLVYELDSELGDIPLAIGDRTRAIIVGVEDELIEQEGQIFALSQCCGSLDAIISLGMVALENNFIKPEVVNDPVIFIKGGRHPIASMNCDIIFVPNDTQLTQNQNVAVITGPNSSGKSVYLKQVGLLVYLAHIGSYIPAERAIIGLTDKILTRISSVEVVHILHLRTSLLSHSVFLSLSYSLIHSLTQSVSTSQSSFTLDLSQMSAIFAQITSHSLCLIDEFGKGTTPYDGIALLAATIKYMASTHAGNRKVKAIFVLHFTEIFHPEVTNITTMSSIFPVMMETTTSDQHVQAAETDAMADDVRYDITPLYTLKRGISKASEGIKCARSAGIPDSIITRAMHIKDCMDKDDHRLQPLELKRNNIIRDNMATGLILDVLRTDWIADNETSKTVIQRIQKMMQSDH